MNEFSKIDIDEKQFYSDYPKLLDLLLFDNTSQKILFGLLTYIPKRDLDISLMILYIVIKLLILKVLL